MALPAGVTEVQRIAAPGGGFYILGSDGGLFTEGGAKFYGSIPGLKGDTLAGRHQFAAGGLELLPTGGYRITDTAGRQYNFDTNYARSMGYDVPDQANTLASDPAYLAFLRTSGLTLETAGNQVRQQTAAINAALDTARGDIDYNAANQARTAKGGMEARGILRSSNTQQALDRVERARLADRTAKETAAATQIGGLNQGLVNKVLEQQGKAAELGLSTAQTQDYSQKIGDIRKKYAPELAQGGLTL